MIRDAALGVADLVARGAGPRSCAASAGHRGAAARARRDRRIAELAELERELAPGLVGLGRYLGLTARRSAEIARALGVAHAGGAARGGRRGAAARGAGRRAEARGADPRGARPRAGAAAAARAAPRPRARARRRGRGGARRRAGRRRRAAGATRASGSPSSAAAADPRPVLERFAALPQIVALLEAGERRAVGVTVEGVPIELVARAPGARSAPRCCARPARPPTSPRSSRCPTRRTRRPSSPRSASPGARPSCARRRPATRRRRCSSSSDIRGDLHCHTTWSDGRARSRRWPAPRSTAATSTSRSATTRRRSARSRGSRADDVRRQGEEIAAANEALAPFRVLRGTECDILPDGRLDLPDDVLAELDWVQASVHGGQRMPRAR